MTFTMDFKYGDKITELQKEFDYLEDSWLEFLVMFHINSEINQRIYPKIDIHRYGSIPDHFDTYSNTYIEDDLKVVKSKIAKVFSVFIDLIIQIVYVDNVLKKGYRASYRVFLNRYEFTLTENNDTKKVLEFDISSNINQYFKLLELNKIFLSKRAKLNTIIEYFNNRRYLVGNYDPNEYYYDNCKDFLGGYYTGVSKTRKLFDAIYECLDVSFSNIHFLDIGNNPQFFIIQYNLDRSKCVLYVKH